MKALTIWQPWASLIMIGAKPYEFRGWKSPRAIVGQRIGIHAGARPVQHREVHELLARLQLPGEAGYTGLRPEIAVPVLERALRVPRGLPLSHMLGTASLGTPQRSEQILAEFGIALGDSDRLEHSNWAWPLTEIVEYAPPQPVSGKQGFWEWHEP